MTNISVQFSSFVAHRPKSVVENLLTLNATQWTLMTQQVRIICFCFPGGHLRHAWRPMACMDVSGQRVAEPCADQTRRQERSAHGVGKTEAIATHSCWRSVHCHVCCLCVLQQALEYTKQFFDDLAIQVAHGVLFSGAHSFIRSLTNLLFQSEVNGVDGYDLVNSAL